MNIFRLQDGRIVERWGRLDDLGFRGNWAYPTGCERWPVESAPAPRSTTGADGRTVGG